MDSLINLIFVGVILAIGYFAGTAIEKRHYKSIIQRERHYMNRPAVTFAKKFSKKLPIEKVELVAGSCVISVDAFKRMLAALRNIFGGEVSSYETLIDRARREAVLRMQEQAHDADVILNMRIETSSIGNSANERDSIGSIEAIAYGTAVTLRKSS